MTNPPYAVWTTTQMAAETQDPTAIDTEEIKRLRDALEQSVRLQSHYATLLNYYDGGDRLRFTTADEWMERLRYLWTTHKGDLKMEIHVPGLALIKRWEGLSLTAYRDVAGVWTIGYGHTGGVHKGETITAATADTFLTWDLEAPEVEVSGRCPNATENQFDAMVSLTFNIGVYAFRSSTLLRRFKEGNLLAAADEFLRWNKAHVDGQLVPVRGLSLRRRDERALFLGIPNNVLDIEIQTYHEGRRVPANTGTGTVTR